MCLHLSPPPLLPIMGPTLSVLIEILQSFSSRQDAPSLSHSSRDPVFSSSQSCGPRPFSHFFLCQVPLRSLIVSFPGQQSSLPQATSTGDYAFTSAKRCSLTAGAVSHTPLQSCWLPQQILLCISQRCKHSSGLSFQLGLRFGHSHPCLSHFSFS